MSVNMRWAMAMVSPDMVPKRHYFMEMMQAPEVIWGIRIACIVIAVMVFAIYRYMKRKSKR